MKIADLRQGIEELIKQPEDISFTTGFNCGVKCALMFVDVYGEHAELEDIMIENTALRNYKYPYGKNDWQE